MATISIISTASRDAYPALLAGLQAEYGHAGAVELATHFLEAEAADFHWESRLAERWLGACDGPESGGEALERIAIAGELRHVWFVAICLVDGDGDIVSMHGLRLVGSAREAHDALEAMR
jgi:hypothetical protein